MEFHWRMGLWDFRCSLYETGDTEVQRFLKETLKTMRTEMAGSTLPGVKILYKHLFGQ